MRIEQVVLSILKLPFVHFFETSFGRESERTFILVEVISEGLVGYGEVVAAQSPLYSSETTTTAWHVLKDFFLPLIQDENIYDPEDFSDKAQKFRGHPMAKAGLEQALWDLKAKQKQVPLSSLYGGNRKEIPSGVSVGIQDTAEHLFDRIREFIAQGYQRVKIKIKPGWDIHICSQVRERFPDLVLQADANGAYSLVDLPEIKKLDDFDLLMLEQPFPPYDLWDHSQLQKEMTTPLCLDESILSALSARKAIEMKSCRIINIKAGRVGGMTESKKIHDLCRKKDVPVWCGGMLESGIGRAHNIHLATLPNFKFPNDISASSRYYKEDIIEPPFVVTDKGMILVPQSPGIGVTPVLDRIKQSTLCQETFSL